MHHTPTETDEDRQMTKDFIKKNDIKVSGWYKFKAFPGTPFWNGEDLTQIDMRVR